MTDWFYPGHAERTKYAVHGGLCALAAICAGYNAIAYVLRGESHLARNTAVYTALACLELTHMERHR